jgi:NagD protein
MNDLHDERSYQFHQLSRLRRIRHLGLDLDGTLFRGSRLFPATGPFLSRLRELGLEYTFLTNNSSRSAAGHARHLQDLGIEARPDQIRTSSMATIEFLRAGPEPARRVFVLGTESLRSEFREAGIAVVLASDPVAPDAVVAGFDPELEFERLCRAAYWIGKGVTFLATHPDRVCPTDRETVLIDCGSVCACLEAATGQAPERVFGKPDRSMLDGILARHGLATEELAMVGDRLYTDVEMARRAGVFSILVQSGDTSAGAARDARPAPDLIEPDVGRLGERLLAAHRAH